MFFLHNWC